MMKGAPGVIEIEWSHKPPTGDAVKLKWLRQYTHEEIDGFRQSWSKSDYERDKVALKELERLRTLRA
jgi:hypothetical protein